MTIITHFTRTRGILIIVRSEYVLDHLNKKKLKQNSVSKCPIQCNNCIVHRCTHLTQEYSYKCRIESFSWSLSSFVLNLAERDVCSLYMIRLIFIRKKKENICWKQLCKQLCYQYECGAIIFDFVFLISLLWFELWINFLSVRISRFSNQPSSIESSVHSTTNYLRTITNEFQPIPLNISIKFKI